MPPWFIDRQVGIREVQGRSLADRRGDRHDRRVGRQRRRQAAATRICRRNGGSPMRTSGISATPDLIVVASGGTHRASRGSRLVGRVLRRFRPHRGPVYSGGRDEAGHGRASVVHHAITYLLETDASGAERSVMLNEYALGKNGDFFPENAGRLMKAGAKNPLPDALLAEWKGDRGIGRSSGSSSIPRGVSRSISRFRRRSATRRRTWTSPPVKRTRVTMATIASRNRRCSCRSSRTCICGASRCASRRYSRRCGSSQSVVPNGTSAGASSTPTPTMSRRFCRPAPSCT